MATYCKGYPVIKIHSGDETITLNDVISYKNDDETIEFATYCYHADDIRNIESSGIVEAIFGLYDGEMITASKIGETTDTFRYTAIHAWIGGAKGSDINPFCVKLFLE